MTTWIDLGMIRFYGLQGKYKNSYAIPKAFNCISGFRLIEFTLIMTIVSSLASTSNTPFGVAILQTTEDPHGSKIAAIIMTIVSSLGSFLMLLFRIFVYFSITRESNNLIPFSTVVLLNISTSIPIVFKILDMVEERFQLFFSMIILVKYFIVPFDILRNQRDLLKKLHKELYEYIEFFSNLSQSFASKATRIFANKPSNQIIPLETLP